MDTATLLQRRALKSFGATPAPVPRRGEDAIDESSSKQIADIIDAMLPPLCVSVSEERAVERERERMREPQRAMLASRREGGKRVCAADLCSRSDRLAPRVRSSPRVPPSLPIAHTHPHTAAPSHITPCIPASWKTMARRLCDTRRRGSRRERTAWSCNAAWSGSLSCDRPRRKECAPCAPSFTRRQWTS